MYARIIGILICVLFVGVSIIPSICSFNNPYDEVDQKQLLKNGSICCLLLAQSFKPALNTLTRVEMFLIREGYPTGNISISIRDHLLGSNLASARVSANSIPTKDYIWVEFDFDDILVTTDKEYYIVFNKGSSFIHWGYAFNDVYPRGELWEYHGEYWSNYSEDFTFKTYGYDYQGNLPPSVDVTYPNNGETVNGTLSINGIVSDPNGVNDVEWVMIQIDENDWMEIDYSPTGIWAYIWDSTTVEDGSHIVRVIASDGSTQSAVVSKEFFVKNSEASDDLDQQQTICDTYDIIGESVTHKAQSFQPMKNKLTRVRLLMYKYGNPFGDIILNLRSSINGTDLATSSKPANILPLEPAMWIEFNFANISVQPGQTYYLIVLGNDYWSRSNFIYWGISSNDVYSKGSSWRYDYPTDKWIQKPDNDYCFITYGFNNSPPNTPTITGKTNGKAGVEYEYCLNYVVDPDGDSVYIWWDWGDGTNTGWLGPYDSGEPMCATHSWSEEGTYTIKAKLKDPYGAESDWASLEVSMPKTKVINLNLFLQRFFQRFPFMAKILNQIIP